MPKYKLKKSLRQRLSERAIEFGRDVRELKRYGRRFYEGTKKSLRKEMERYGW